MGVTPSNKVFVCREHTAVASDSGAFTAGFVLCMYRVKFTYSCESVASANRNFHNNDNGKYVM